MRSMIQRLDDYDREQQAIIEEQALEIADLKARLANVLSMLMDASDRNDQKTLQLILAGHFDKLQEKQ